MKTKQKVRMQLLGLDGNAFSIMGAFKRNAMRQGWTPDEIKQVLDEAMSGDYDHLLRTIINNVDDSYDENDEL